MVECEKLNVNGYCGTPPHLLMIDCARVSVPHPGPGAPGTVPFAIMTGGEGTVATASSRVTVHLRHQWRST